MTRAANNLLSTFPKGKRLPPIEDNPFAALSALVARIAPIDEAELRDGIVALKPTLANLSKDEFFISQGEAVRHMAVVLRGLLKVYITSPAGKIYTKVFVAENELAGAYRSFITGEPSTVSIRALEDCQLLVFDSARLRAYVLGNPTWHQLGRAIAEMYFCECEAREFDQVMLDATGRYEQFVSQRADLVARLTQKEIADYLGVSPISLSRIRHRRARRSRQ